MAQGEGQSQGSRLGAGLKPAGGYGGQAGVLPPLFTGGVYHQLMRLPLAAPVVAAWLAAASPCLAASQVPGLPRLDWRAPDALGPQAERLARFDTGRLLAVMRLVGLEEAGPPIPVVLVPEDAPLARDTPQWIAGFATGGRAVVLFPARTPSYPYDSIDQLLQHEIAHILIARAAGGRFVPRWFHEGVAHAAERAWTLGDRAQFAVDVAFGGASPPRRSTGCSRRPRHLRRATA